MEKELVELFEAAKKAAEAAKSDEGGAEESRCLDAFEQLKNFPVTYSLLCSTQVLKFNNPIRFFYFLYLIFIYLFYFGFINFVCMIANIYREYVDV